MQAFSPGTWNVIWTNENKIEMFGHNSQYYVWPKPNTLFQLPTVVIEGWWFRGLFKVEYELFY